jgi:cyclophilin family peptidyl-prolyl cis-trans isomerase
MDVVLPIFGSFQEGFYDPLTAKPRRIPLEVVAFDGASPNKVALTYSSLYASIGDAAAAGTTKYSEVVSSSSAQRSFSSATSSSSSNSTTTSYNLKPLLSFDIPNIVALNHPDRAVDGGSSEFFALPKRDISPKKTSLLDGQYAPFGYIVEGTDVINALRPGDVIGATYVSELGQLNLVKIRKNAFEGGDE